MDALPISMQVSFGENSVMSSCVKPLVRSETSPVVLLHGFDRSFTNNSHC